MAMLMIALPSSAQNYKNSQYYNQKTGHLDYHFNSYLGEAYLPSPTSLPTMRVWMAAIGRPVSTWVSLAVLRSASQHLYSWRRVSTI